MKAKYFIIILFVFFLLNGIGTLSAIADEYSLATNSWIEQSSNKNAKVLQQIQDLKNRKSIASSGQGTKGNLSLANPSQSVAKTTQSNKLQQKEQLRKARKNALIQMLASRPVSQHLMVVNSNKANNEQ